MNEKLKPCPFCGGKAISFSEYDGLTLSGQNMYRGYAGCQNPECGIGFEWFHEGDDWCTEEDADNETCEGLERKCITLWNTRYERTTNLTYEYEHYEGYKGRLGKCECGNTVEFAEWVGEGSNGGYLVIERSPYCSMCGAKVVC